MDITPAIKKMPVDKPPSWVRFFFWSAGFLLLITAAGKLVSAAGHAHILENEDPLLSISFRRVFETVGLFEVVIALFCFFGKRPILKAVLVAWLATNFLVYRLGLLWIGYHKPCSCMGNLTDALHIPPEIAGIAMKIILFYLLLGSYATWFWLWRRDGKVKRSMQNSEAMAGTG